MDVITEVLMLKLALTTALIALAIEACSDDGDSGTTAGTTANTENALQTHQCDPYCEYNGANDSAITDTTPIVEDTKVYDPRCVAGDIDFCPQLGLTQYKDIPPGTPLYTPGTMTDPRDGRVYRTTTIGHQTWMAENLRLTYSYTIGEGLTRQYISPIRTCAEGADSITTGCSYNLLSALSTYDSLSGTTFVASCNTQNLGEVITYQGICPPGWHLPSRVEVDTLISRIRSYTVNEVERCNVTSNDWSDDYGLAVNNSYWLNSCGYYTFDIGCSGGIKDLKKACKSVNYCYPYDTHFPVRCIKD